MAEADNELGVETVRARPCRHGHCSPERLIGQSVGAFERERVSVAIKIVCSGTLMRSFLSCCCCCVMLVSIVFINHSCTCTTSYQSHILVFKCTRDHVIQNCKITADGDPVGHLS